MNFFFGHAFCFEGSYFPNQGLNSQAPAWKRQVLTPGLPGNFPMISIRKNYFHFLELSKKRWLIFTKQEFIKNKIPAGYTKKDFIGSGGTTSKWSLITEQMNKPKHIYAKRLTVNQSILRPLMRGEKKDTSILQSLSGLTPSSCVTVIKYVLLILNT